MKYIISVIITILFPFISVHLYAHDNTTEKNYPFIWGTSPNLESISTDFMSFSNLTFDIITDSIDNSSYDNPGYRLANSLFQLILGNSLWAMAPHECGHVSRAHEYGVDAEVSSVMPFDGWYRYTTPFYSVSPEKRMMISASGPAVNTLSLYSVSKQMYSGEKVPAYYGMYELMRTIPMISYMVNFRSYLNNPDDYLKNVNYSKPGDSFAYGVSLAEIYAGKRGYLDSYTGSKDDLPYYLNQTMGGFMKDQSNRMMIAYSLQLLDPAILSAVYGTVSGYIINGDPYFKPWMMQVGDIRFMPSIRADMGELGIENCFDMFFLVKDLPPFSVYYRYGGNEDNSLHGGGFEIRDIPVIAGLKINLQADYWNSYLNRSGFNTAAAFDIAADRIIDIILSAGYKTEGLVSGSSLDKGFYGHGGIGLTF